MGDFKTTENAMVEYLRDKNNKIKGILFADDDIERPGAVIIGFSLARKTDIPPMVSVSSIRTGGFNRDFGLKLAQKRSLDYRDLCNLKMYNDELIIADSDDDEPINENSMPVPICSIMEAPLMRFILRCERFYKDKIFPKWVDTFRSVLEKLEEKVKAEHEQGKVHAQGIASLIDMFTGYMHEADPSDVHAAYIVMTQLCGAKFSKDAKEELDAIFEIGKIPVKISE